MTVKELIDKLQQYPDNVEVHVGDSDGYSTYAPKDARIGLPYHGLHGDKEKVVVIE